MNKLTVKPIEKQLANEIVVKYHYLHREPNNLFSYALYNKTEIIGICIFGKPASPFPCMLFGKEEMSRVLELTRLFTIDNAFPNKEPYFISIGHTGYIYQASNWKYFDLTHEHVQWEFDGQSPVHCRHKWDKFGGVTSAKEKLNLLKGSRPQKHRYFYLRGNKKRRKYLMAQFKYEILPYPKNGNIDANPYTEKIVLSQPALFDCHAKFHDKAVK
jgi:hypothetical protein